MKTLRQCIVLVMVFSLISNAAFAGTFWVDTNLDTDPNTCVEDETDNDDDCTLRDAVSQLTTGDTIRFLENETITNANGTYTLSVNNVMLDGTTDSRTIALNGNGASNDGITITGDGITVQGLYVYGFDGGDTNSGVVVNSTADAATIQNNIIGLQTDGSTVDANAYGMHIDGTNTVINSNTISGNSIIGIKIDTAKDVVIKGNKIGTNSAGTTAKGNNQAGIAIGLGGATWSLNGGDGGTEGIVIGGDETAERNIISGNTSMGIITGDASDIISGNIAIQGNYIGVGSDGSTQIANGSNGISTGGSGNTTTGVDWTIGANGDGVNDAAEGNVISGNGGLGINIDSGDDLFISGNKIGFAVDGTTAMGNTNTAVQVDAANIRIGSDLNGTSDSLEGNLIGNSGGAGSHGISISGAEPDTIKIYGNKIGVDVNGANDHGNTGDGININDTSTDATTINIGGVGPTAAVDGRNIVSNNSHGIKVTSAGPGSTVTVQNNVIGYNSDGTTTASNTNEGVEISDSGGSITVFVGTDGNSTNDSSEGNTIGNCGSAGVLAAAGVNVLTIAGNIIKSIGGNGIDVNGTDFSSAVTIGGDIAAERNVIGGNTQNGIRIKRVGSTPVNLTIRGNYIGVDTDGTTAVGNGAGVTIQDGAALSIVDNVISNSSDGPGVVVTDGGTSLTVTGNRFGTTTADAPAGNVGGGLVVDSLTLTSVVIGGATAALSNVFAASLTDAAIVIASLSAGTVPVTIKGNYIGVCANLSTGSIGLANLAACKNEDNGISVYTGALTIGGDNSLGDSGTGAIGEGNVISNNTGKGIQFTGLNVISAVVYGNIIGLVRSDGGVFNTAAGNGKAGIKVDSLFIPSLTIGGVGDTTILSKRNVISSNGDSGVYVANMESDGVLTLINNYIGTDWLGTTARPNAVSGLYVAADASIDTITVGNGTVNGRNVISGNTGAGLYLTAGGITIKGNCLGVASDCSTVLDNGSYNIHAVSTAGSIPSLTIGGSTSEYKNKIANTNRMGIYLADVTPSNESTLDTDNLWTVVANLTYSFWQRFVLSGLTNFGPQQCYDGVDNDRNGYTDYPSDTGCSGYTDSDESSPGAGALILSGVTPGRNIGSANEDAGVGVEDIGGGVVDNGADTVIEAIDFSEPESAEITEPAAESVTEPAAEPVSSQPADTAVPPVAVVHQVLSRAINVVTGGPSVNNLGVLITSHKKSAKQRKKLEVTKEQKELTEALETLDKTALNKGEKVAKEKIAMSLKDTVKEIGEPVELEMFGEKVKADEKSDISFYWSVDEARKAHKKDKRKLVFHPSTDSNGDGLADMIAIMGNKAFLTKAGLSLGEQYYFDGDLANTYLTRDEMLPKVPTITNVLGDETIVGKEMMLWVGYKEAGENVELFVVDPETLEEYYVDEVEIDENNKASYVLNFENVSDFELGDEARKAYLVVQDSEGKGSMAEVKIDPNLELDAQYVRLSKDIISSANVGNTRKNGLMKSLYSTVLLASEDSSEDLAEEDREYILTGLAEPGTMVMVTWKSLTYSSVAIADAAQGYFEIKAPKELKKGDHEAIVYVYNKPRNLVGNITSLLFSK